MFYTIYKITNKVNGKEYTGKHQTDDVNDKYMGSGKHIVRAIKKDGIENFVKEILHIFDNEDEMNHKEAELVTEDYCSRSDTYNICPGGKGGWGYVNSLGLHSGDNNIMRRCPETKQRVFENAKKTRLTNKDFYANIARVNGRKSKGQTTQSFESRQKNTKDRWEKDKEGYRDCLSSWFLVESPNKKVYETNRLEEFCIERNLTYTSIWNTTRTNKPVKKGKSKGWICRKI